jgi:hypothetical protein
MHLCKVMRGQAGDEHLCTSLIFLSSSAATQRSRSVQNLPSKLKQSGQLPKQGFHRASEHGLGILRLNFQHRSSTHHPQQTKAQAYSLSLITHLSLCSDCSSAAQGGDLGPFARGQVRHVTQMRNMSQTFAICQPCTLR